MTNLRKGERYAVGSVLVALVMTVMGTRYMFIYFHDYPSFAPVAIKYKGVSVASFCKMC